MAQACYLESVGSFKGLILNFVIVGPEQPLVQGLFSPI